MAIDAAKVMMNVRRRFAVTLSHSYKRLFQPAALSRDAEIVLADLRQFCGAMKTPFHPDPYIAARNAGRLEVWMRITNLLHLDEAQVRKLMELDDGD